MMTDSNIPPEIERILDDLAGDEDAIELTKAQRAELERRIALHEQSPDRGSSWEEVKRRIVGE